MEHKIIHTENYLLVVSDEEIKEGDIFYRNNDVIDCTYVKVKPKDSDKKIIAHLPLNNSPILQGIDLLPPLEQEDDVEKYSKECNQLYKDWLVTGYKSGYNKAKEKFVYTKEQLIWAIQEAYGHGQDDEFDGVFHLAESIEVITKHLSQPKLPVAFKKKESGFVISGGLRTGDENQPIGLQTHITYNTTTNSQGQTVWVGEYIY